MDKLEILFDLQNKLQIKLGNFPFKNNKHKQEFININTLASIDEALEALRETCWKNPAYISCGWKTSQEYNEENFKNELVDEWHFLINKTIASEMDAKELYERFVNKNKINHERRNNGY